MWRLAAGLLGVLLMAGAKPALALEGCRDGSAIVGRWEFYKIIFKGQERDPFNPDLNLTFEFFSNGENLLRWTREGERGFCERRGRYTFEQGYLEDEVIWVNPDNNRDCGMDPDMRLGNRTKSPAALVGDDFHLFLHVNDDPLIYAWRRLNPPAQP